MRIIHCAPFNIFTKTGGSLYANPIKISQGLMQNGHFVHNFDYRDTARYLSVFKSKKGGLKKMNHFFLNLINEIKPDLIIFGHAELIEEETFKKIKSLGIPMLFWYNDVPISNGFKSVSHYFEAAFTTAGGDFLESMNDLDTNLFFMPNLVDKSVERYYGYQNENYESDLLFSGRYDKERASLIDFLKTTFEKKINMKFIGHDKDSVVIGEAYFEALKNSKICLNHNRDFTLPYQWFTSDRLMHILGNGSFALSTPIVKGEDFFEDKLEYYTSYEELVSKLEYYIENSDERVQKAKWLRKRVHTLFNAKRVSQYILDAYHQDTSALNKYEWVE